ncbi:MAG: 16S rRNA processing protein RimM [Candidatus Melainabacteria bacterium GWF2_37_15]|nr:MAG: 16S rRNA processing protein RimM [Candidatus Melainabacteria bacterium GWF2_37_15]
MQNLLSIGKILNFHGIKGEVKVGFTEGDEKIFSEIAELFAVRGSQTTILTIEQLRFHKKFALIKFKEINSVDEAIEFKGSLLKAPKELLEKYLQEDEFYISDLVGLNAYDEEGNLLGKISGVVNIKEQDTLFIKDESNKETMVPFNREIVPDVDLKEKRITIRRIEGLFE